MNNIEFKKLEDWIKQVDEKLDNHLITIGKDITEIKTDMSWVKRFFWLITGISMTAIVSAIFSLIIK